MTDEKPDNGDTCQMVRKMMSNPERYWFCHLQTVSDPQKMPVSRRVCDSGHRDDDVEQKGGRKRRKMLRK